MAEVKEQRDVNRTSPALFPKGKQRNAGTGRVRQS